MKVLAGDGKRVRTSDADLSLLGVRGPDCPGRCAASEGHVKVLTALIEKGADVNRANSAGVPSLVAACMRGQSDAARALLGAAGVEVDC